MPCPRCHIQIPILYDSLVPVVGDGKECSALQSPLVPIKEESLYTKHQTLDVVLLRAQMT